MPMERNLSFNTLMKVTYEHDDEGTSELTNTTVLTVMGTVEKSFPGALPSHRMAKHAANLLGEHAGYEPDTTLLATALCSDEVNRDLEDELRQLFGNNYNMGGLAGFAFGGLTAFGAVAHHTPLGGNCLIIYGPHVGIDWDGKLGKVNRRGHKGSGACCGPAEAAYEYVKKVKSGLLDEPTNPGADVLDSQQNWVTKELLVHAERLEGADEPMAELPQALYDCQDGIMTRIVAKGCTQLEEGTKIALLGGVTINTPEGTPEYFLPKKFEVLNGKGETVADLLQDLLSVPVPNVGGARSSIAGGGTKTYG